MMAPTTARPAASGRMCPARKFQADASMSVVANCEPLFQPCISCIVLLIESIKIAAMIDGRGLCPCAASSAALRTKNEAVIGTSRETMKPETKFLKLVSIEVTQPAPAPDCGGREIPCAANHDRTWGSVNRITDHTIHF